jgi:anti-sigma B factor antagonist
MQVEDKAIGAVTVVKVYDKRLVAKVAVEFKENMLRLINQGNRSLALDLSDVDFVDSSGLGAIVSSLKAIGRDGDLVVCGLKEPVMQVFSLTRMDKVFRIFSNVEEAAAYLGK